jgi:hypothetical protein
VHNGLNRTRPFRPTRKDLLKALADHHETTFGVLAVVERTGRVAAGDLCSWDCGRAPDQGQISRFPQSPVPRL